MIEDRFKRSKAELLAEIEEIRRRNNTLHIEVYRIALDAEPEEMRRIIEEIADNDAEVISLMKEACA